MCKQWDAALFYDPISFCETILVMRIYLNLHDLAAK